MRRFRVGVVGCGVSSDEHLRIYSRLKNVTLASVYDIDSEKAREKARRYRVREISKDYDSMLRMELDVIDIVTPTQTHSQLALLALESGHNVLVEKPMALSSKECETMIGTASRNGRALCVMHNKRFYKSVTRMRSIVDSEGLCASRMNILHLYPNPVPGFTRPNWIMTEKSGGVLWESMVHDSYLSEYFMGKPRTIYGIADKIKEPVSDSITLILRNEEKVAVCQTEWNQREPVEILQLITKQGDRFIADLPQDTLLRRSRLYKNRTATIMRALYDDLHDPFIKWSTHLKNIAVTRSFEMALPFERTFLVLIQSFLAHLDGTLESVPVPPEEGLRAIRVLETAKRSIETGTPQSID